MAAEQTATPSRLISVACRHSDLVAYTAAAVIGLVFVAWLFPVSRLFPTHAYEQAFTGDSAALVIGQRYFTADVWRWPLLVSPHLAAPHGTNIALTDSIPLAALMLKILRAWLPQGAYVLDLWTAFVCAVQPVAAVFALRSAGERRLVPALASAVIAISLPTFLVRMPCHPSLASHFLLLLSIGLYYRLLTQSYRQWLPAAAVLLLGSLLIQPYLLVMAAAVLFAAPLTLCLRGSPRWWGTALAIGLTCLPTVIAFLALGYGGTKAPPDFGMFSMNLVAPVRPQLSVLIPTAVLDATGGQAIEGYQYLGAGLLLLCAIAATLVLGAERSRLRPSGLVVVGLVMALFALSGKIYAGHILLLDIGPVPGLIRQFHASGRFFWPAAYALIIWSVSTLGRSIPSKWLMPVLASTALLQFADAAAVRRGVWAYERTVEPWTAPRATLLPAMQAATRLTIWPTALCGASVMPDSPFMQILLLASQTALPTNTMYVAHVQQTAPCDEATALAAPLRPGELLIILPPAGEQHIPLVPGYPQTCRKRPPLTLCASSPDLLEHL